mgnify:CR=1 FL=1
MRKPSNMYINCTHIARVIASPDNIQQVLVVKDTYGISEGKTIISEEVIRCLKGDNISRYDSDNSYMCFQATQKFCFFEI